MPTCPYCGKSFRTKRGLMQHIYRSHPFALETMGKDIRKSLEETRKTAKSLLPSLFNSSIQRKRSSRKKSSSKKKSSRKKSSSKKKSSKRSSRKSSRHSIGWWF